MTFSLESALFLLICTAVFYIVRKELRMLVLLAASLSFMALLDVRSFWWFLASSISVYVIGLIVDKFSESKAVSWIICAFGIVLCAGTLLLFKCSGMMKISDDALKFFILPIGFSYYIFQAIAYLADIGSCKIRAQKDPVILLLYLGFFPKFVSGPIERPEGFMEELKGLGDVRLFDSERLSGSFACLLYGFFMKVVVADRLSVHTQVILNDPQSFRWTWLIAGMLMYTIQIYCDFAGYSSVAIGCANLFGIKLTQNFRAPYLAADISTFWRRWHISLSGWLKDYVYIPLGGSRRGILRRCINTMIVFLVCGFWHGAGLNFVIWGLLHGIYSVICILWKKTGYSLPVWISRVITFLAVSAAWVFFGVSGAGTGVRYFSCMFTASGGILEAAEQLDMLAFTAVDQLIPVYVLIVFLLDCREQRTGLAFEKRVFTISPACRYLLYYAMIIGIFLLGAYGPSYNAGDFMYMRF